MKGRNFEIHLIMLFFHWLVVALWRGFKDIDVKLFGVVQDVTNSHMPHFFFWRIFSFESSYATSFRFFIDITDAYLFSEVQFQILNFIFLVVIKLNWGRHLVVEHDRTFEFQFENLSLSSFLIWKFTFFIVF